MKPEEKVVVQQTLEMANATLHEALDYIAKLKEENAALRQLLEQPTTEDSSEVGHGDELTIAYMSGLYDGKKMAKREWVGLTHEEIDICLHEDVQGDCEWHEYARAIEAKLREKNGGAA